MKQRHLDLIDIATKIDRDYISKDLEVPVSIKDELISLARNKYNYKLKDLVFSQDKIFYLLMKLKNSSSTLADIKTETISDVMYHSHEDEELFLLGLINLIPYSEEG